MVAQGYVRVSEGNPHLFVEVKSFPRQASFLEPDLERIFYPVEYANKLGIVGGMIRRLSGSDEIDPAALGSSMEFILPTGRGMERFAVEISRAVASKALKASDPTAGILKAGEAYKPDFVGNVCRSVIRGGFQSIQIPEDMYVGCSVGAKAIVFTVMKKGDLRVEPNTLRREEEQVQEGERPGRGESSPVNASLEVAEVIRTVGLKQEKYTRVSVVFKPESQLK